MKREHSAVVFYKWRWPLSPRPSKGIAVDKQANDDVVHLCGVREADGLADQVFDARPYGQMLALDLLRVPLAWTGLPCKSPYARSIFMLRGVPAPGTWQFYRNVAFSRVCASVRH
jgi:hypothetical protein